MWISESEMTLFVDSIESRVARKYGLKRKTKPPPITLTVYYKACKVFVMHIIGASCIMCRSHFLCGISTTSCCCCCWIYFGLFSLLLLNAWIVYMHSHNIEFRNVVSLVLVRMNGHLDWHKWAYSSYIHIIIITVCFLTVVSFLLLLLSCDFCIVHLIQ